MENNNTACTPELPMKWHKFLIYFSLWLSMIMWAVNGVSVGFGLNLGENAEFILRRYEGLGVLNMAYLIASIGLLVYTFMTRQKLAGYKADGPKWLCRLYLINLAVEMAYVLLLCAITGVNVIEMLSGEIASLITPFVMYKVNQDYYAKRAHLFTEA